MDCVSLSLPFHQHILLRIPSVFHGRPYYMLWKVSFFFDIWYGIPCCFFFHLLVFLRFIFVRNDLQKMENHMIYCRICLVYYWYTIHPLSNFFSQKRVGMFPKTVSYLEYWKISLLLRVRAIFILLFKTLFAHATTQKLWNICSNFSRFRKNGLYLILLSCLLTRGSNWQSLRGTENWGQTL